MAPESDIAFVITAPMTGGVAVGSLIAHDTLTVRLLESCRRSALALSQTATVSVEILPHTRSWAVQEIAR